MLRSASVGSDTVNLKYDPDGNRIYKESSNGAAATRRKYIVAMADTLPVILMELDPDNNNAPVRSNIYVNDQPIIQHAGGYNGDRCFYLSDRLNNVRMILSDDGSTCNSYCYEPFGESFASETQETVENHFMFTGQYYDQELDQYHLRNRQLSCSLNRFISRDPYDADFREPLTLHRYLYCLNDPINHTDPKGLFLGGIVGFLGNMAYRSALSACSMMATYGAFYEAVGMMLAIQYMQSANILMTGTDPETGMEVGAFGYILAGMDFLPGGQYIKGPINNSAKKLFRKQARDLFKSTIGEALIKNKHIHHIIPLEWAHKFPALDPNSRRNLMALPKAAHDDISGIWTRFRSYYKNLGREPSQIEVLNKVIEIQDQYGQSGITL